MKQRALVDIDLLLDTRYGTIKRISESLADTLADSDKYRLRHHDKFDVLTDGQIDQSVYQDLYAKRDIETLFHARMTDFVHHFRQDIIEGIDKLHRGVIIDAISVDINVYPYDITDQEADVIMRSLSYFIPAPATVSVVRLSPEMLTPMYVENHYEMMAWYNHEDWLGPNTDALIKHPLKDTVLLTPTISTSGEVPQPTAEIGDPFSCRSAMLIKFITLHYIPTGHSCYNPFIRRQIRNSRSTAAAHPERPPQEP